MFKKFFIIVFNIVLLIGLTYGIYFIYNNYFQNSSLLNGPLGLILNANNIIVEYESKNVLISNSTSEKFNVSENISEIFDNTSDNKNITPKYFRYYYNQLDYTARVIYSALERNINNLKSENFNIDFSKTFNNLLNQKNGQKSLNKSFQSAIDAFTYDHPELFYLDVTKMSLIIESTTFATKTTYNTYIAPKDNNYLKYNFSSNDQLETAISQVESLKNTIVNNVNGSDYNKALIVHDTLVDLMKYDETYSRSNTHNIYGALVEKQAVCEGYAKAFKYILDSLDIPCILVSGTGNNSSGQTEAHMWNYVLLNNNWYAVDVTWDDPIIVGGFIKNTIKHDYFCKGYSKFHSSHVPHGNISGEGMKFTLPTLSNIDYK